MKNILTAAGVFVVAALVGGFGYKAYIGCPKFDDVACIEQSRAAFDPQKGFKVAIKPLTTQADNLQFEVTSDFTCPVALGLRLSLDHTTLPDWQLGDLIEPAYISTGIANLENGKGVVTFSVEDHPELNIIPAGTYIVSAKVAEYRMSPVKFAYYSKAFNLGAEGAPLLSGKEAIQLETSSADAKSYNTYLQNWLQGLETARRDGITAKTLSQLKGLYGPVQKTETAETVVYTFPETMHQFVVRKDDSSLIEAKRYSHEGEEIQ